MLDIKRIRADFDSVLKAVESRGHGDFGLSTLPEMDAEKREILAQVEAMRSEQNKTSKLIPQLKKEGKDTSGVMAEMKELSEKAKSLSAEIDALDQKIKELILGIPNTPDSTVPVGTDDSDNVEIRRWGEPKNFAFQPKAHWDIGSDLDILDFERAAKISGTRFTVYKGLGARLERSIINFMPEQEIQQRWPMQ